LNLGITELDLGTTHCANRDWALTAISTISTDLKKAKGVQRPGPRAGDYGNNAIGNYAIPRWAKGSGENGPTHRAFGPCKKRSGNS